MNRPINCIQAFILLTIVPLSFNRVDARAAVSSISDSNSADKKGSPKDQFDLGVAYLEGRGVSKDSTQAGIWFQKAGDQGYAPAWNALGSLYCNGNGTTVDYNKAREYYRKAIDSGDSKAMYNLARMDELGLGQDKNTSSALALYIKSGESGLARAYQHLGEIYFYGDAGQSRDFVKARGYFERASAQGVSAADNFLGSMAEQGQGQPKSSRSALNDYLKSAKGGNAQAMSNLGRIYFEGECGVTKDELKGMVWLCISEAKGWGNAKTMIEQYGQKIDPKLLQEARIQAKNIMDSKSGLPE